MPNPPRCPFRVGVPLDIHDYWIGRDSILHDSVKGIASGTAQCTNIHGERRIGKTTLLRRIAHQLEDGGFTVHAFDLQSVECNSPEDFWRTAASRAGAAQGAQELALKLRSLAARGTRLAWVIDEFDRAFEKEWVNGQPFQENLRSFTQDPTATVAIVIATRKPLGELTLPDGKTSPFNVFAARRLGPLEPHEVTALLRQPPGGVLTDDDVDLATRLVGADRSPWRAQAAGEAVWHERDALHHVGPLGTTSVGRVEQRFDGNLGGHAPRSAVAKSRLSTVTKGLSDLITGDRGWKLVIAAVAVLWAAAWAVGASTGWYGIPNPKSVVEWIASLFHEGPGAAP
ncbi:MAG TPA: ATP-binding protein [Microthrixaceae bacterium]|nr:ATP-binding protein [Microthrixaceae bacterium]HMT23598.1 ATP-binding protein [Microthrixaceae bacterium]HMT63145.1 ATP-binding protein [Microthrixaceae bacterium]